MEKQLAKIIIVFGLFHAIGIQGQSYYTKSNIETNLSSFTTVNGQWNASNPSANTLGSYHYQGLNFGFDVNNYACLVNGVESNELYFGRWSGNWKGWRQIIMTSENGNVGIGTTSPNSKLVIATGNDAVSLHTGTVNCIGFNSNALDGAIFNASKSAWQFSARDEIFTLEGYNGPPSALLTVLKNGNIGIGTVSPGYKLDVIGSIRAREIKVDLSGADFVFENEYKLMPLSELEKFVKENKHLPEIAPAKEMQENGTNLGDLNTKLLQKIEELTLYMIQIKKENDIMKKENQEMKSDISKIKLKK
jgi:hypothetical protein